MRLKQKFTEKDIEEIGRVFAVTMRLNTNRKIGIRWGNLFLFTAAVILFVLGCGVYILERTVVNITGISIGAALFFLLIYFLLELMKSSVDNYPLRMVRNKYRNPFRVSLENDTLIYKGEGFLLKDIDAVAEYKHFLFVYANRKWMIIKAGKEEKKFIMNILRPYVEIRFYREDSPFNMKELQ